MYDAIAVGTDGSENAQEAVERAVNLAREHDAELHVITVVNTARYGEPALSSHELVLNELEDRANRQLDAISEYGTEAGVRVVTRCFHGDPSEEIVEYARENDVDLIVLGARGRTHPRSTIGSTASRVLQDIDHEVLVV
ncbi:universal stress protein [Halapricum sp. CBA1109]|uniref:universal stress protein n=1 Tax=Halapricum sp. CBA1109 TaxID=2668068 RepID=UPI0012FC748F|nr:universal stress protein [Halapricum sp. CBA1109]MUV88967.1 universal stress protein [Halapricum sp. CBA1109]